MQLLNYLFTIAMAASVSAAPSVRGTTLETRQDQCPYPPGYTCIGNKRSACLGSGLDICKDGGFGGPSKPCDDFCKAQATAECEAMRCCSYTKPASCVGDKRSACLGSGLDICNDGHFGGPSKPCDDFCKAQATDQCAALGC